MLYEQYNQNKEIDLQILEFIEAYREGDIAAMDAALDIIQYLRD